jgi:hypothetical protein
MNDDAKRENRLTLQMLLKVDEKTSEKIVGSAILLSLKDFPHLEKFLYDILSKTFSRVDVDVQENIKYDCEVYAGDNKRSQGKCSVNISCNAERIVLISSVGHHASFPKDRHPFFYFLIGCYVGPVVLKAMYKKSLDHSCLELTINFKDLVPDESILDKYVDVGESYLAGAGAVGNAFLYALTLFKCKGSIKICDPDFVSGGNLNRCLFFNENDIGAKKVDVLAAKASIGTDLKLTPYPYELSKVPDRREGAWLRKLIVGVDSRRARRNLQGELPFEVFDASTTGISEVVIHHNRMSNTTEACLGCVYIKEANELAHESHIAKALGVTIKDVQEQFVSEEAAKAIARKYGLRDYDLVNVPYDTLFKQLCGEGKLMTEKNAQILAPLAFVSALAGAILALRFIEEHLSIDRYNYWRLSPWGSINLRLQQRLLRNPLCAQCGHPVYNEVVSATWGKTID